MKKVWAIPAFVFLIFCSCVIPMNEPPRGPGSEDYSELPYNADAPLNYTEEGMASFIADEMQGKTTASGVPFNIRQLVAAHPSLPFGSRVQVTNMNNNKSVNVTIIDVGPFVKGRIIDVSFEAAKRLEFIEDGTTKVRVTVISLGNGTVNPEAL